MNWQQWYKSTCCYLTKPFKEDARGQNWILIFNWGILIYDTIFLLLPKHFPSALGCLWLSKNPKEFSDISTTKTSSHLLVVTIISSNLKSIKLVGLPLNSGRLKAQQVGIGLSQS